MGLRAGFFFYSKALTLTEEEEEEEEEEDMDEARHQPLCAEEALNLLNCVTESPFDQDKCLRLLHSLRDCVLNKKVKKFSLTDQNQQKADPNNKKLD
ncbi:hypothetical protein L1049_022772 [Liquidambar formosana]|uniref:Uncharacterized protein n=1 Tax=Liquidambar formosana TaxID=63359 RepID=A0AAP0RCZ4_LIQFO